jgi:hypothetical protein
MRKGCNMDFKNIDISPELREKAQMRWATKKGTDMKDEKSKDTNPALEQKPEVKEEDAREIADEKLEKVAGGTVPIIKPF